MPVIKCAMAAAVAAAVIGSPALSSESPLTVEEAVEIAVTAEDPA